MKTLYLGIILSVACSDGLMSQDKIENMTIEAIIDETLRVLSGPAGQSRDWDRFRLMFKPTAQFIVAPKDKETGSNKLVVRSLEETIENQSAWLKENPLFESAIFKKVERYRHLAHVLCTYEARKSETEVYGLGVSSFQLMHDGKRWWIVNWFWLGESSEEPIPKSYLPAD